MRRHIYNGNAVRNAALIAGIWAAIGLVVLAFFNPKAAAAGWLVGFAFWAQIFLGSLTLTMIHRLTSGGWGKIIAPATEPAAAATPLLIVLVLPLFIAIPTLYPWARLPAAIRPDVLSLYLNTPSFIVRSLIALAGWSLFALWLPRTTGRTSQLLAALGLVFHAFIVGSIAVDWLLSVQAPFTSSSFGASVAIAALLAALAWAVTVMPDTEGDLSIGDVGGLLLATILGLTYIDFMAVLVIWYGDLPREEIWFVERDGLPWSILAAAAFLMVSLLPTLALMLANVRNAHRSLRKVGICVLIGLAAYNTYLVGPPAGAWTLVSAPIAIVCIGFGFIALSMSGAADFILSRETFDAR